MQNRATRKGQNLEEILSMHDYKPTYIETRNRNLPSESETHSLEIKNVATHTQQ